MKEDKRPQLHVVAGVVEHEGYLLAVQREKGRHTYTDYKWEFPGGKIEEGEKAEEALSRELKEEMDYAVVVERKLGTVEHRYPDFDIRLEFFLCHPEGEAEAFELKEHRSSKWLLPEELRDPDWAEADMDFVVELQQELLGDAKEANTDEELAEESSPTPDDGEGKGPSNKELWMVLILLAVLTVAYFVQHGF